MSMMACCRCLSAAAIAAAGQAACHAVSIASEAATVGWTGVVLRGMQFMK